MNKETLLTRRHFVEAATLGTALILAGCGKKEVKTTAEDKLWLAKGYLPPKEKYPLVPEEEILAKKRVLNTMDAMRLSANKFFKGAENYLMQQIKAENADVDIYPQLFGHNKEEKNMGLVAVVSPDNKKVTQRILISGDYVLNRSTAEQLALDLVYTVSLLGNTINFLDTLKPASPDEVLNALQKRLTNPDLALGIQSEAFATAAKAYLEYKKLVNINRAQKTVWEEAANEYQKDNGDLQSPSWLEFVRQKSREKSGVLNMFFATSFFATEKERQEAVEEAERILAEHPKDSRIRRRELVGKIFLVGGGAAAGAFLWNLLNEETSKNTDAPTPMSKRRGLDYNPRSTPAK